MVTRGFNDGVSRGLDAYDNVWVSHTVLAYERLLELFVHAHKLTYTFVPQLTRIIYEALLIGVGHLDATVTSIMQIPETQI